ILVGQRNAARAQHRRAVLVCVGAGQDRCEVVAGIRRIVVGLRVTREDWTGRSEADLVTGIGAPWILDVESRAAYRGDCSGVESGGFRSARVRLDALESVIGSSRGSPELGEVAAA